MDEKMRPFIETARKRHMRRPPNPGVRIEQEGKQGWKFGSMHRDLEAWEIQIFDAFGTRSQSTVWTFLNQLTLLCYGQPDYGPMGWTPDENEINAAINIISGSRPRNEIEAILVAQMVAIHIMLMKTAARSLRFGECEPNAAATAGKLARTYAIQCDALAKLKGRSGKQRITVRYERHNHNHDHKHIHAEIDGGVSGFEGRPQGPSARVGGVSAIEHEPGPALSGPDAARDGVPMPGNAGADAVSNPRGRARIRRAEGGA